MMKQTMDEFAQAGSKMAGDTQTVIDDGKRLLEAAANVSDEGFAVARGRFEEKLAHAKAKFADTSRAAIDKTRKTAAATDAYVRRSPWKAVGVAAAAGMLIGVLVSRR